MSDSNITKRALAQTMKELMAREPFSKISVGDICGTCGMSRKSFYYHFKDKYDLVSWIFYTEFIQTIPTAGYDSPWDFLEGICDYFYREHEFYRSAMQIQGQNSFREYFSEVMSPFIDQFLRRVFHQDAPSPFFQTFLTDAFLASLIRWLSDGVQYTPEEYLANLKKLLVELARQVLRDLDDCADQK